MPNWKKVIVSGSNVSQLNNDGVYLRTTGDGVISSSAQIAGEISGAFTAPSGGFSTRITSLETAGGTTFSSSIASRVTNVETDLNTLESKTLVSSSAQLTTEFDTRYLNTTGDGVISSSAQVTISSTTGFTTFSSSIATSITSVSNIVNGGGGTFTSITLGPPSPQTSNYATVDSTASGSFVLHGTSNYVLDTFYTGSAVEYNYVARDGIKTGRMGTIKVISAFANYSNGEISFYETSTPDIDPVGASTNGLVFSFDSNGSGSNTGRFLVSNTTGTNLIVVFERKEWNLVY